MPEAGAAAIIGFSLSGIEAQCQETDTILEVARASGLNIPSACQFGVCGTCKIRKLKGEVHMVHNGGITDREIDQGYSLACCSRPPGRVAVEVLQHVIRPLSRRPEIGRASCRARGGKKV